MAPSKEIISLPHTTLYTQNDNCPAVLSAMDSSATTYDDDRIECIVSLAFGGPGLADAN